MALYILRLEILGHVHKYFGDFDNFISSDIKHGSQKYQTLEGFWKALYEVLGIASICLRELGRVPTSGFLQVGMMFPLQSGDSGVVQTSE